MTRALLFQSKLPNTYWSYVVLHAAFLINRICTPLLHNESPYELLFLVKPDLIELKMFGCLYVSTLCNSRYKLDYRAKKPIFLGLKHGVKVYITLDLHNREIVYRNVAFFENNFLY